MNKIDSQIIVFRVDDKRNILAKRLEPINEVFFRDRENTFILHEDHTNRVFKQVWILTEEVTPNLNDLGSLWFEDKKAAIIYALQTKAF